tara:strand:+ start:1180 stop:1953 length:774 start_codon:yes stop_codon:yes gene_type:complete
MWSYFRDERRLNLLSLFLAIALQSSADDCAILEAITPPQVETGDIESRPGEYPDSIVFSGIGLAVFVGAEPPLYFSDTALFGPGDAARFEFQIPVGEAESFFSRIENWRESASREERLSSARANLEESTDYLRREIGDIPEGLFENFISAAIDDSPWSCTERDFSIFHSSDDRQLAVSLLPYGTDTEFYHSTRPGYSSDGNWALVYGSSSWERTQLLMDDGSLTPGGGGGRYGYILLSRDVLGVWSIARLLPIVISN